MHAPTKIKIPVNVPKEVVPKLKKILYESNEFTLAEIYQHAANLKISNVECRNWLLLHGAHIRAIASTKIIAGKPRCRFFDELPYETKIALLKKTHHIGKVRIITAAMIQELADELNLPLIPLKNWLKNKRRRDQTCIRQLSKEVIESLKKEFEKCNYLDEDQALFLAYELNSPSTLIKKWFINQRFQEQKSQVEKIKSGKVRRFARKTVEQKNILFEVFKHSPNYIGHDKMREVENMTNLTAKQIGKWLSCIRVKWSKCSKSQLKKDLTKNMNQELLTIFEREYKKNRFLVDEAELMKQTGKSIFVLRNWFSKRRLYELRSGGLSLVEEFNEADKSNEIKGNEITEASTETKSVVNDDIEFFKKLSQSCKIRLFKACKEENPPYEKLSRDIGVSANVIKEWIANRKQNEDLKDEESEDEQVSNDIPLTHEPSSKRLFVQKNILFEEFKKQPKLSLSKVKSLASRVHLTTLQIRKWFYNYQKMLNKHTREKVLATVKDSVFPSSTILKLEEYYKKNRFITDVEAEEMAVRFNLTRGQIKNWFVFARYYEILFGFAPNSKATKSSSLNSFMNKLEPGKQRRLIDELKHYPFGDEKIAALSSELNLSIDDLHNWFEKSLSSNLTIKQKMAKNNRMNFPKIQALKYEFLKNPELSVERCRSLSMRYKINKDRLREWFERRKTLESVEKEAQPEEKETEEPVPTSREMQMKMLKTPIISVPKASVSDLTSSTNEKRSYKMPLQQSQLFDEFKLSPYLSNERLQKLINQTGLLGKQINAWFQWMRVKLADIDRDTLTEENRNQNLSPELIAILEREYAKNRYLSTEAREKLATQLNLTKGLLKTWFAKRRYYEILGEPLPEGRERYPRASEIENIQIDEDSMEADRVETVIVYDWEAEGEEAEVETQENPVLPKDNESVESKANFDPSILIAQAPAANDKRCRVFTLLNADLEPVDKDINNMFWFLRKNPKDKKQSVANETIDAEKDAYLEKELEKNPWKTMDEIADLSTKLNVSETLIHWWFMKKRCLLTKTVLTFKIDPPKAVPESSPFVDLTDDDTIEQIFNEPEKLNAHDFEFVAFNENEMKRENFVDESGIECEVDPMLVDNVVKSPSVQEEVKNVPTLKKKKKQVPLTSHQRSILMQEFKRCKYISGTKARMLANDLGLSVNRVDIWFESMRKSSEKKPDVTANSKDKSEKLTSLIVETLETEFQKSSNFSEKRIKLIAYKLNVSTKMVKRWIFQKMKSGKNVDVGK